MDKKTLRREIREKKRAMTEADMVRRSEKLAEQFLEMKTETPQIFYIWGHSYEFDIDNSWDHFEEFCSYKGLTKQSDEYSECEWFGEFVKDYLPVKGEECLAIDNEYIKWLLEKYKGSTEYYEFIYKICEELETENVEEVEKGLIDYYFS